MADIQPAGNCSKCQGNHVTCKYNHFEQGDLVIDSWEHKCPDCGVRQTTAYRSDDSDELPPNGDTSVCPYCSRQGKT